MASVLSGSAVAEAITASVMSRVSLLRSRGTVPALSVLRVGENESDLSYERGIIRRCRETGITVRSHAFPAACTSGDLLDEIEKINGDTALHGCLLLRPLPKQLDEQLICRSLLPQKDVDGMTPASQSRTFSGSGEGYSPCAAQACMEILDHYGIDPAGMNAAVIGRSLVLGKPLSMLLQARNATVTVCHTKTKNTAEICAGAELLVAAAGQAELVDENYVNPLQIVIDAGIHPRPGGGLCGDVRFDVVEPLVKAITPVPDGVGAVTAAVLCAHIVEAAEKSVRQQP